MSSAAMHASREVGSAQREGEGRGSGKDMWKYGSMLQPAGTVCAPHEIKQNAERYKTTVAQAEHFHYYSQQPSPSRVPQHAWAALCFL